MVRNIGSLNSRKILYEVVYQPKNQEGVAVIQAESYREALYICNALIMDGSIAYIRKQSRIFLIGDTHGDFRKLWNICLLEQTQPEDVIIILGDAGINTGNDNLDSEKKKYLSELPATLFCVYGNHEERPTNLPYYKEKKWRGGSVLFEDAYPNILFAKDGEIFDLNGNQTLVIGGAYSVDRMIRLMRGLPWWKDEQPSDEIKKYTEEHLEKCGWKVDVVLSHTAPLKYEPLEAFLPGIDQSTVDKTTEVWLDSIEDRLSYKHWFCGHYHVDMKKGPVHILFNKYKKLE